jgi:hypothetical protein
MRHVTPFVVTSAIVACGGALAFAQVGRGGSQWLTALADAQRTSWIRTDDKVSPETMAKGGFELQWKKKLDNRPRGVHGLTQGVTASGVTLFVPMSLVGGSSNNVYGIDNDLGYVVWERQFDVVMPAATSGCPGGMTAAATRIVRLDASATASTTNPFGGGRGAVGYRSLLGQPGEGVPVEGRIGGRGAAAGGARGAAPAPGAAPGGARGAAPGAGPQRGAPPPAGGAGGRGQAERIPGAPKAAEGGAFGFLGRPSGVVYVVSSDGMLHVLGLPSGKDMQKPAPFLPANAKWSAPIAVDTTLYTATSAGCGGAPHAVWAIDLDSEAKPVTSWKTNGGPVVGALAFTSNGTVIAAVGPGQATGDGRANAIVALDAKTLQLKDWFTQPAAEFATGPTIITHGSRELVAAATKDGRVLLLDAASLGGADHATPLASSAPFAGAGGTVSADALAAWQQQPQSAAAQAPAADGTSWILLPIAGRLAAGLPATNGPVTNGAVVALRIGGSGSTLTLAPGWVSHDLAAPGTPITVNGVVFTLATGVPASARVKGSRAILHAYDGATGKRFWNSGTAIATYASPGSFWSGLGQIYVGGQDGTLYAFGFNDERRAVSGN